MVSEPVKLTARQEETLVTMSRLSEPMPAWLVGHVMRRTASTAQSHMNVLAARGLIEAAEKRNPYGAHYWRLTPAGRAYLAVLALIQEDRPNG